MQEIFHEVQSVKGNCLAVVLVIIILSFNLNKFIRQAKVVKIKDDKKIIDKGKKIMQKINVF